MSTSTATRPHATSSMSMSSAQPPRTYGGWRRTRGIGLFGLGAVATAVVLACIVLPLLALSTSVRAGLVVALPCGLVAVLTVARFDGAPLTDVVLRRGQFTWARMRGYTSLRAGVVVEHPSAWQLPGALATTRLLSVADGRGGAFGLVQDERSGMLTATLRCASSSTWLVDSDAADGWVASWHSWLASRGFDPLVAWVAVTVDTAPEPGSTLARNVASRLHPEAPADVLALLRELILRSPAAAADVDTRVSITFDPSRAGERLPDLADRTAEVARALTGMEAALGECGVTVLGRATAAELAGTVRTAFDPASRGDVNTLLDDALPSSSGAGTCPLLAWGEAGPVAAEDSWGTYRHDSGTSVSWAWHEAPRQQVTANVLTRLLSPGRFPRRVTLLFRPLPAGAAARVLESQVNAAAFRDAYRRSQGRDATARDIADRERAVAAAREEALGAGVVLMSLYVTTTVLDGDDDTALAAAIADTEARADQSKVRLRRLWGSQALGFATTLPAGLHPAHVAGRVLA
ncbi:SCO6880 family protein [Quadrisphaera sp. INWT6]|uniref:SCO6880 family protein n=1 Tax=Quadrisphaera sp. INWT6 TaxID=2596917 RepID=UPI0019D5A950|nr:SCO6880 family protein [Quadrisphaera sp. INWT6]